jgi:hypothetical protein
LLIPQFTRIILSNAAVKAIQKHNAQGTIIIIINAADVDDA